MNMKKDHFRLAGIFFAAAATLKFIALISYLYNYSYYIDGWNYLQGLVEIVPLIFFACVLLMKKRDIALFIASIIFAAGCLFELLLHIHFQSAPIDYLLQLSAIAGSVIVMLFVMSDPVQPVASIDIGGLRKIWFLPAILIAVNSLANIIRIFYYLNNSYVYSTYTSFAALIDVVEYVFPTILTALGVLFLLMDYSKAETVTGISPGQQNGASAGLLKYSPETVKNIELSSLGYFNIAAHVLLLIFTCGIWLLVWIYRTTKSANRVETKPKQSPTAQLFLNLIPFYNIYWTYCTSQKIDAQAHKVNLASDISTLCLVFSIFVPIVPPIVMQAKLNDTAYAEYNIIHASGNSAEGYTAPAANPSTASEPSAQSNVRLDTTKCTNCGNAISIDASFCPYCGNRVVHVATVNENSNEKIADYTKMHDDESDTSTFMMTCPCCNKTFSINESDFFDESDSLIKLFCPHCGSKLAFSDELSCELIDLHFGTDDAKQSDAPVKKSFADRADDPIKLKETFEEIMAVVKPAICSKLKSPASAQFPVDLISIVGDDVRGYRIEGFVDSQNGFGAVLRNDFTADVKVENGFPKVVSSSVAAKANVQRAKNFGVRYLAITIITIIGGAVLFFIISAMVGL